MKAAWRHLPKNTQKYTVCLFDTSFLTMQLCALLIIYLFWDTHCIVAVNGASLIIQQDSVLQSHYIPWIVFNRFGHLWKNRGCYEAVYNTTFWRLTVNHCRKSGTEQADSTVITTFHCILYHVPTGTSCLERFISFQHCSAASSLQEDLDAAALCN